MKYDGENYVNFQELHRGGKEAYAINTSLALVTLNYNLCEINFISFHPSTSCCYILNFLYFNQVYEQQIFVATYTLLRLLQITHSLMELSPT
jgi:hypothetical protein